MPKKTKISEKTVARREKRRASEARRSDNAKRAKRTLSNTEQNRVKWARNPGRYDLEGLDTPGGRGRARSFWRRLLG